MSSQPDMSDRHAQLFRRLGMGDDLNGEAAGLPDHLAPVARFIGGLDRELRPEAVEAFLLSHPSGRAMLKRIASVDPYAPILDDGAHAVKGCATLADVRRLIAESQWPWPNWLQAGAANALAADPGVGKTMFAMCLARQVWFGDAWADGAMNPFLAGTKTLWVAGDRHFTQLADLAQRFGIPDEAMLFNGPPDDPTGGLDLDDSEEREALEARVKAEKPGFLIIDTVGMSTDKNLCKPEDARQFFGPLMDLAQRTGIILLFLTHLSKDNQALGRRIVGACRSVIKLSCPDPEGQPNRRKVWVDKSYLLKPPALGMTIGDDGCVFDFSPPIAPDPMKVGRPPEKLDKAITFLVERLGESDRKQVELITEWEKLGENKGTLFSAIRAMQERGRLVVDESAKPKVCHLVRNYDEGQE